MAICIDANLNRPRNEWAGIGIGAGAGAGLIYGYGPYGYGRGLWSQSSNVRTSSMTGLFYLALMGGALGGVVGVIMQNAVPSTVAPIQQDAAAL
jgi:hypothetical protein